MNPYAIGGAALAFLAALAFGLYERGEAIQSNTRADLAESLVKGWSVAWIKQAAETRTGNDFVAQAAEACGAQVKSIVRAEAGAKEIRDAKPGDALRVLSDGLCRDYPDAAACRTDQGAARR